MNVSIDPDLLCVLEQFTSLSPSLFICKILINIYCRVVVKTKMIIDNAGFFLFFGHKLIEKESKCPSSYAESKRRAPGMKFPLLDC